MGSGKKNFYTGRGNILVASSRLSWVNLLHVRIISSKKPILSRLVLKNLSRSGQKIFGWEPDQPLIFTAGQKFAWVSMDPFSIKSTFKLKS